MSDKAEEMRRKAEKMMRQFEMLAQEAEDEAGPSSGGEGHTAVPGGQITYYYMLKGIPMGAPAKETAKGGGAGKKGGKEKKSEAPAAPAPSAPRASAPGFHASEAPEHFRAPGFITASTVPSTATVHKYSRRTLVKDLLTSGLAWVGQTVTVAGWIRTKRLQGNDTFAFVEVNDGTSFANVQVIINDQTKEGFDEAMGAHMGASIRVTGEVVKSPGAKQPIEVVAHTSRILCDASTDEYPLSKSRMNFDTLRDIAHLRARTNTMGAVQRMRNAMCFATHQFFQSRGFQYVHTPLITASDCEGAGEMFRVTTLIDQKGNVPKTKAGVVDWSKDFFKAPAMLTVSGQLNVETYCCALSNVYTFGPTFRAENSHTPRHLAEFWMIEPEMAFADIEDNMACAEDYLKFCVQYALDNNREDLQFFEQHIEKGIIAKLESVVEGAFARVTYTEVIDILSEAIASGKIRFDEEKKNVIKWGMDLASEHERYICETVFQRPTIVRNYPKGIKSFYMRLNEDGETVAAMDILCPKIGEIIGGSQREERFDHLKQRLKDMGLPEEPYSWYLDLRRFGSVPHAGFGLGLERLIMFTTGMANIRDVIPFPRYPGHAEF